MGISSRRKLLRSAPATKVTTVEAEREHVPQNRESHFRTPDESSLKEVSRSRRCKVADCYTPSILFDYAKTMCEPRFTSGMTLKISHKHKRRNQFLSE